MKYTLFIYFYNHILVLIICVNNSLGASTYSYGMCFLKKLCFSNQSPIVALWSSILCEKMAESFFLEWGTPLWEDGWELLSWVGDLVSEIIPKKVLESSGPAWSILVAMLGRSGCHLGKVAAAGLAARLRWLPKNWWRERNSSRAG